MAFPGRFRYGWLLCALSLVAGCKSKTSSEATPASPQAAPAYFHVDPATAGTLSGAVHFTGKKPASKPIDLSEDPACVEAHHGKAIDESLVVAKEGGLANAFVYISKGLEGKQFEPPATPVTIDQNGCWFRPHVLGIQTGQVLNVTNSDPVTHNIHPMAQVNREWNHSQGPGDAPLARKFSKQEIMIPIKCNIHAWMRAYLGVVEHPYFAVTKEDGTFTLPNLPAGNYTLTVWHEKLGTQQQEITVAAHATATSNFTYKGN